MKNSEYIKTEELVIDLTKEECNPSLMKTATERVIDYFHAVQNGRVWSDDVVVQMTIQQFHLLLSMDQYEMILRPKGHFMGLKIRIAL